MRVTAIVVAAGCGSRLGLRLSKALVPLCGKPLVMYSLQVLDGCPGITDIVLVANPRNRANLIKGIKRYRVKKISAIVLGGARRQDSVLRGLEAIDERSDLVLIQDAARPFINAELVDLLISRAAMKGSAVAAVPVKSTIKEAVVRRPSCVVRGDTIVKETLDRKRLWEAQTPQVFKIDIIKKAYKKFGHREVTDDAALVELAGYKVELVKADYSNIKITTPIDLTIAAALLKRGRSPRYHPIEL